MIKPGKDHECVPFDSSLHFWCGIAEWRLLRAAIVAATCAVVCARARTVQAQVAPPLITTDGTTTNNTTRKISVTAGCTQTNSGTTSSWVCAGTGAPTTRKVSTSSPLGGGGALSSDLTLTCVSCITGTPTAAGDLLYSAAGGSAMSVIPAAAAPGFLITNGIGTPPSYSNTLTTPIISAGLTAIGAGAHNFSGSIGTFITPTGALTLGPGATSMTGNVTIAPATGRPLTITGVAGQSGVSYTGTQPAAVSGTGIPQGVAFSVIGGQGGDTTGTTGQTAGGGENIQLAAGNGGAAPPGSTNGAGGDILIKAGAPGNAAGFGGVKGLVKIIAPSGTYGDVLVVQDNVSITRASIQDTGIFKGKGLTLTNLLISNTAPTISSGFGTGASVTSNNGTAAFRVNVGTTSASTGVIGLPTATTGWNCYCTDITTNSASVSQCKQTASTVMSATIGNFTDLAVAAAWADNDAIAVSCFAF